VTLSLFSFGLDETVGTPTSVVLMALNAAVGFDRRPPLAIAPPPPRSFANPEHASERSCASRGRKELSTMRVRVGRTTIATIHVKRILLTAALAAAVGYAAGWLGGQHGAQASSGPGAAQVLTVRPVLGLPELVAVGDEAVPYHHL
jgi:hypothetical protein